MRKHSTWLGWLITVAMLALFIGAVEVFGSRSGSPRGIPIGRYYLTLVPLLAAKRPVVCRVHGFRGYQSPYAYYVFWFYVSPQPKR